MRSSPLTDHDHNPSGRSTPPADSTNGAETGGGETTAGAAPEGAALDTNDVAERVTDLESQLRYALADLDNVRKRYARDLERERMAERERAGRLWLPVLDHLDLALSHLGEETSAAAGIESIRAAALAAIAELGFPRFDDIGQPFDPARHEAISTVNSPDEAGTIVTAVRPGYGAQVVLRPASVIVAQEGPGG